MLIHFEFKQTQNRLGGCNQVRITTNPLGHLALTLFGNDVNGGYP
jgi:hypothetical protein